MVTKSDDAEMCLKEISGISFHYRHCGLKNVWLTNGFTISGQAEDGGVVISAPDNLHRLIGRLIVALPRRLSGAEFQFLRRELDLTLRQLAELLGCSTAEAAECESSLVKPVANDNLGRKIRVLYAEMFAGELAEGPVDRPAWHFAYEARGWFLMP